MIQLKSLVKRMAPMWVWNRHKLKQASLGVLTGFYILLRGMPGESGVWRGRRGEGSLVRAAWRERRGDSGATSRISALNR